MWCSLEYVRSVQGRHMLPASHSSSHSPHQQYWWHPNTDMVLQTVTVMPVKKGTRALQARWHAQLAVRQSILLHSGFTSTCNRYGRSSPLWRCRQLKLLVPWILSWILRLLTCIVTGSLATKTEIAFTHAFVQISPPCSPIDCLSHCTHRIYPFTGAVCRLTQHDPRRYSVIYSI